MCENGREGKGKGVQVSEGVGVKGGKVCKIQTGRV